MFKYALNTVIEYMFVVHVCPVLTIDEGVLDVKHCFKSGHCKVGTTVRYICDPGFVASLPTTTCLADHTWSNTTSCAKGWDI